MELRFSHSFVSLLLCLENTFEYPKLKKRNPFSPFSKLRVLNFEASSAKFENKIEIFMDGKGSFFQN